MPWATTTEAGAFLAEAGKFLASDPVANSVLLTGARFWARSSNPVPGGRFGWWDEDDEVVGAFVHVPDHAPICSALTTASVAELPNVLITALRLGVQAKDVAGVTAAWWAARRQVLRRAVAQSPGRETSHVGN